LTYPGPYCARSATSSIFAGSNGLMACMTLNFSSRTARGSKVTGGSMATRQTTCSRWFWIMSRSAPDSS
jgi:hypothetical protein